jgi:hypothetical protein
MAFFNAPDLFNSKFILKDLILHDIQQFWLFTENKPNHGHTVPQGKRLNGHPPVIVYFIRLISGERMKNYVIGQVYPKLLSEMIKGNFQVAVCINMQIRFSAQEVIGGKQSIQSENMIPVEVAYEDMVYTGHVD